MESQARRFTPQNFVGTAWRPPREEPFNLLLYLQGLEKGTAGNDLVRIPRVRQALDTAAGHWIAEENPGRVGVHGNIDARTLLRWFYSTQHTAQGQNHARDMVEAKLGSNVPGTFANEAELMDNITDWAACWAAVRMRCFTDYLKSLTREDQHRWATRHYVFQWGLDINKAIHRLDFANDMKLINIDKFYSSNAMTPYRPLMGATTYFEQAIGFAYRLSREEGTNLRAFLGAEE